MKLAVVVLAVFAVGCTDDLDPPWQLDHDRIVAVRVEPPGITSGSAVVDGLLSIKGEGTRVAPPEAALVVSPMALAGALVNDAGTWRVVMPSEQEMVAAREELGLPAGSPVAMLVGVGWLGTELKATKTVLLGVDHQNPSVDSARIAEARDAEGQLMLEQTELVIDAMTETHFRVELAAPEDDDVVWLTSCGTMHDFDLPESFITIEDEDPTEGELAVVVRDERGGVAWRVWPIRAE